MVRLELDQVVMRRMKEDEIDLVKALVKVCTPTVACWGIWLLFSPHPS